MAEFDQRSQQVGQQLNAGRDIIQAPPSDRELQKRRYRDWLLGRVEQRQSDFFKNSLHGATLIELGLNQRPGVVLPAGSLVLHLTTDQSEHILPPGTHLIDIYKKQAGEKLLILGAPGTGKTTMLVELGRELLKLAQEDDARPVPVVFNLASWNVDRLPLSEWLVSVLQNLHLIRFDIAQTWIETDRIALLLDGLNEVQKEYLPACIRAINEFMRNHGAAAIVISCRESDYLGQAERVTMESAIVIQPLRREQVDEYLSRGGERLEAVSTLLHNDPELLEMARTPLMLDILTMTYAGKSARDIPLTNISKTRQEALKDYVTAMLQRDQATTCYTSPQTIHWLAWLAGQLERHSQTEFQLEHLQPDWLERRQQYFYRVIVRCCSILICALLALLGGGLFSLLIDLPALSFHNWSVDQLLFHQKSGRNRFDGPTLGLLFGAIIGLLVGLTHHIEREIKPAEVIRWSWPDMRQKLARMEILRWGLLIGVVVAICFGVKVWIDFMNATKVEQETNDLFSHIVYNVLIGLLAGLPSSRVISAISELLTKTQEELPDILPGQTIKYSVLNRIIIGCIGGLTAGLITGLVFGTSVCMIYLHIHPAPHPFTYLLICWLFFGLPVTFVGGLVIGYIHRVRKNIRPLEIISYLPASIYREFRKSEAFEYLPVIVLSFGSAYLVAIGGNWQFAVGLGLLIGLLCWLLFEVLSGCLGGLSSSLLEERKRSKPGQGIHSSVQNGLVVGLVSFGVGWMFFGLFFYLLNAFPIIQQISGAGEANGPWFGVFSGLLNGVFLALVAGLFIGLAYGGTAYIQYIVLRILLWRTGCIPWKYIPFLGYANDHVLLTRLGGGYIFIHPLLRAYFASLEGAQPASAQEEALAQIAGCTCGCPARPGARFCPCCGKPVQPL